MLGPTHYRWRRDVGEIAQKVENRFPQLRCNTYEAHPWPGWDGRSLDVWRLPGRGTPLTVDEGRAVVKFLFNLSGPPAIRHYIFLDTLWTSFGGYSTWTSRDHSGNLRHVHVTYW